MSSKNASRQCLYLHPDGRGCRAWAMRDREPPRCAAHRFDGGPAVGAPDGNKNRLVHGWYARPEKPILTIEDAVENLGEQLARSTAILAETNDSEVFIKIFNLHAQALTRLGHLLRDQRALSGDSADSLLDVIGVALDEISTELGIEL